MQVLLFRQQLYYFITEEAHSGIRCGFTARKCLWAIYVAIEEVYHYSPLQCNLKFSHYAGWNTCQCVLTIYALCSSNFMTRWTTFDHKEKKRTHRKAQIGHFHKAGHQFCQSSRFTYSLIFIWHHSKVVVFRCRICIFTMSWKRVSFGFIYGHFLAAVHTLLRLLYFRLLCCSSQLYCIYIMARRSFFLERNPFQFMYLLKFDI